MNQYQKCVGIVLGLFSAAAVQAQSTNTPAAITSALTSSVGSSFDGGFGVGLSILVVLVVLSAVLAGVKVFKRR